MPSKSLLLPDVDWRVVVEHAVAPLFDFREVACMLMTGSAQIDAERAFSRAARSRRRAALKRWLRRESAGRAQLRIYDERTQRGARAQPGPRIREIPLEAVRGTLEPTKAALFDGCFRPAERARPRWQRLWLAEHRGAVLPPISVVAIGDAYAIRDGHHRVSVAKWRGALTIDATVEAVR
jgi:hypothetical protein